MRGPIHLINPLWDAGGGSEWRTLGLFELLSPHADVRLWSEAEADRTFLGRYPIQRIGPGRHPVGGTLVFVGVYFRIGAWVAQARAQRVIIVYNTVSPEGLAQVLQGVARLGAPRPEVVFSSESLRARTPGVDGPCHASPIDVDRFSPAMNRPERPFTVGRLSRDTVEKHHPEDVQVYQALAAPGCRVRIMGGTILRDALGEVPEVELLPAKAEPAERFLQSLDAFFYRTHPRYFETWGRVVSEAMACGLPCVVGDNGGFNDFVSPAESFSVTGTDEAIERLLTLAAQPDLAQRMGRAARERALELMGDDAMSAQAAFYLGE